MRGGMALGSLLTGFSVHWFGVRAALLFNGVLALLVQALIRRDWMRGSPTPGPDLSLRQLGS